MTAVYLSCPSCGHEWHEADYVAGAWFCEGSTPEAIAQRPECPACQQEPPMQLRQSQHYLLTATAQRRAGGRE